MGVIYYIDLLNGNDGLNGLSFSQRWRTLGRISPVAQPGDVIKVMESLAPTNTGLTATWINGNAELTASANVCKSLATGGWSVISPVTYALDTTDYKSVSSDKFVLPTSFSGKAAYLGYGSPVNGSAYQQVSFWFKNNAAVGAGKLSLRLCSDTAGNTTVHTVAIPAVPSQDTWVPITINLGSALASSIQSIALYIDAGLTATLTVHLNNIVLCYAPGSNCITHQTLVGKPSSSGAGGDDSETWFAVSRLVNNVIGIDSHANCPQPNRKGYWGLGEAVALWVRQPILTPLQASIFDAPNELTSSGSVDARVEWQFGWNTSNMTAQTGETWLSGQSGFGSGLKVDAAFNTVVKLGLVRYFFGLWLDNSHCGVYDMAGVGHCTNPNVFLDGPSTSNKIRVRQIFNGGDSGFRDHPYGGDNDLRFDRVRSNRNYGCEISTNDLLHDSHIQFNAKSALLTATNVRAYRVVTDNNGSDSGDGVGYGLKAEYYNSIDLTGTPYVRTESDINFFWDYGTSPAPGIGHDPFSLRLTGWVQPNYSETYTFTVNSDDGVRVWIDDVLVVDRWTIHAPVDDVFSMAMVAGQRYKLKVEYYETVSTGDLHLYWQSMSTAFRTVPPAAFSHGTAATAAVEVASQPSPACEINLHDCLLNEVSLFSGLANFINARVRCHNHQQIKGNHLMITDGGTVVQEAGANRRTLTGLAWKMTPSYPRSALYPLDYKLASIAVLPSRPVTVGGWFKRSSTAVTAQILVRGGELDGVPAEVIATAAAAAGTYEQLRITFTPTEIGVIDVFARVYGGTLANVWVDDLSVSQA